MASVNITDNTPQIKSDIAQKASIFLRLAADAVMDIAEPNTPKKRGNLRRDVVRQVLGLNGKIVWGKNYAKFQETKQFKNYSTPGTGPHFARNAIYEMIKKTGNLGKKAGLI